MKLISRIQPTEFLGIQYTQLIMRKIPGHTVCSHVTITCQNCTLYSKIPGYGVTFVHVLTYLSSLCTLSKMAGKEQDHAVLQYSGVPKIRESKALLVRYCSKRLEEYGLTLWVVSIVLYVQESQA